MESKMGNPKHSFRETDLVLQLIEELQIKSKTVMSWSSRKKKESIFLYRLPCPTGIFLRFVFHLNILNALAEYTYFYISKNNTSYNFLCILHNT